MEITSRKFLNAAAAQHPRAAAALAAWVNTVAHAHWKNPVELKQSFTDIDPVKVKSGNTVYVCNIRGNEFRLIMAVHFNRDRVYVLRFLTHAEYDRQNWKQEL
jgi:mRNA interferase HigB